MIRAYDPRPAAYAMQGETPVKLFGARRISLSDSATAGTIIEIDDGGMVVACGPSGEPRDAVQVSAVQPAGKRRLTPREWQRGRAVAVGDRLS
jgi:methionyl-tRNA formyltransferase